MALENFPSCHVHPQSLDSASTPEAFAAREVELGSGVITCTDHGTLAACRKVYDLGKKKGLIPVLGLEAYLRDDDCPILAAHGYAKNERGAFVDAPKYMHVTMHALDQEGFQCMIRLLSKADANLEARLERMEEDARKHGSERKPLFTWTDLEELGSHNITMTTGCMIGAVQRHLLENDDMKTAEAYFAKLKSIVKPGNLYTELNPHDTSKNWIKGIFVTLANGEKFKFWDKKKLLTNVGEIQADNLARAFARSGECAHKVLKSIKDQRKWRDMAESEIVSVEDIEEFVQNECRPWAPNGDLQAGLNRAMKLLARKFGVPVIIGDDSHYALPDEKVVQDVRLAQNGNWRFYGHYHRQSSAEALAHFQRTLGTQEAEFAGWVDNARAWASRFKDFTFETPVSLPTKFYEEKYAQQPWYKEGSRDNSLKYIGQLINKHGRMDWKNPVLVKRLKQEINLLHNNGIIDLLPYFMIDEEVCSFYESKRMLTGPGRGSAAGLLLTFLLGITHVDPLRYELSVDRFLTLDRIKSGKLPDIDQDLPSRDILVGDGVVRGWLHERFGDHVAQISVDTTLKLKSAVKDVSRAMRGHVPPELEIWTKKFIMPPQGVNDIDHVLGYDADEGHVQGSIEYDEVLQDYVRKYPDDWEIVKKSLGLARQKSRHACAYVIANRPIEEFIPLTTVSEVRVTAYTAPSVEAVGGLKMDFLVINSLNDIGDAIQMIQKRAGLPEDAFAEDRAINGLRVPGYRVVPIKTGLKGLYEYADIWDLPADQAVFADVACGRTETVFQFNTPGAIQWLQHFGNKKPSGNYAIDSIESMAAFTALDRPGPLDIDVSNPDGTGKHNMLVEYARRARGATPSPDVLAVFDQLIPETYGVMVYQEQLQKIYQVLTGCSGADAEEFRSNVAKKKKKLVEAAYTPFIEAASKQIGRESAEAAWQFFITWAKYGFNKSHAVCYSVIGYACAYLKHHYPLEWWTAVLRNAAKNEVAEKFWKHAGHLIDLPDVKCSGENFEIQGDRIRAPVSLLKGIGKKAHVQITAGAPYTDIADFCEKIEAYRVATGKYVMKKKTKKDKTQPKVLDEKTGKMTFPDIEVEEEVFKKGTSALNRKVVQTLIISGAMDSLFPSEMHLGEQLVEFERVLCEKTGQKTVKVDAKLWDVGPLKRYQMRKAVLPIYGADLTGMTADSELNKNFQRHGSGDLTFLWVPPKSSRLVTLDVATAEQVEGLQRADMSDGQPIQVAVVAHVDDTRTFRFGEESREACELTLDIEGARFKFMKWAGKDINLPSQFKEQLKGAIAIVVLNKYKPDRPFVADDIFMVQPPLDHDDSEEETAEEEKTDE